MFAKHAHLRISLLILIVYVVLYATLTLLLVLVKSSDMYVGFGLLAYGITWPSSKMFAIPLSSCLGKVLDSTTIYHFREWIALGIVGAFHVTIVISLFLHFVRMLYLKNKY
jgi:hypothetical protein